MTTTPESLGAFGQRVWPAFMAKVEAGTWPVEHLTWESRPFVRGIYGHRCYWLARGGLVESSVLSVGILEPPRDELPFYVCELAAFASDDRLVDLAVSILWSAYELRIEAMVAAAKVHGVDAGPDNARVFFFGGLLTKEWTESEDDNPERWARHLVAGRLELAAAIRGKDLGAEPGRASSPQAPVAAPAEPVMA